MTVGTYSPPVASDAEAVHWSEGLLASRPSAAAAFAAARGPVVYYATDENGGTLYKTATGSAWTQVAPGGTHAGDASLHSSGQEVAYVANETGTVQVLTTSMADLTLMTINIPLSTRPIHLRCRVFADVTTTAGAAVTGVAAVQLVDSQGTPVVVGYDQANFEGGFGTNGLAVVKPFFRIAAGTPARTYKAQASVSGTSFAARIYHGALATCFRSEIWAEYK